MPFLLSKYFWVALIFFIYSSLSQSQILSPQIDPPKVDQQKEILLVFTSLMHWWEQNFIKAKKICDFYESYGAPPIDKSTDQLMKKIIPTAKKDLQSCAKKYKGIIFTDKELDSAVNMYLGNGAGLLNLLQSTIRDVPLSPPRNKYEVQKGWESCQGLILPARQHYESLQSISGYPESGWCEKLIKSAH